jgi:ABC-type polysaccharide/polyol phosphate export permease
VTFLALIAILTPITIAIRGTLDVALLLLPFALACLFGFVLGLAFAVSILHAYFRDVAPILSAALLPWFFLSPIFFEPSHLDRFSDNTALLFVLEWVNPVAPFIVALRDVIYGGVVPEPAVIAYVLIATALSLAGGLTLFRRMQGELAVVV